MDYKEYITIDSSIRFGRPCIKGTRISVFDILSWLASGMSMEEVIQDYPELSHEHVKAALAYGFLVNPEFWSSLRFRLI